MPAPDTRRRLIELLGADRVRDDPTELASFRSRNPLLDPAERPLYVLRPAGIEHLQALVRVASEIELGLVPVSSGPPHVSGGIDCQRPHAIVDLGPWNRILHVDRRNRVCTIEPGVTYDDLERALAPRGLTVPRPLAPRAAKSVVAAVMDRTPGTWPNKQWDIADPVASTELVFGTGDLFRTGSAGGPGSLEKQREAGGAQKSPLGPSQTDFHRVVGGSQGSIGIVTWISLRAELRPSAERAFLVGAHALEPLVKTVYPVQRAGLGEQCLILDRTAAAMLLEARADRAYDEVRRSLPAFVCLVNVAGFERLPRERLEYQVADIREIVERNGLVLSEAIGQSSGSELLLAASWADCAEDFRHRRSGHCLCVFFLTTLDRAERFVAIFSELAAAEGVDRERLGVYLQPIVQNHACHVELWVPFDPDSMSQVARMARLEERAVGRLAEAGAFFSRPYGSAARVVFGQNPAGTELLHRVKRVFDPHAVLSPAKFGMGARP